MLVLGMSGRAARAPVYRCLQMQSMGCTATGARLIRVLYLLELD
jgi:hypothetical protein